MDHARRFTLISCVAHRRHAGVPETIAKTPTTPSHALLPSTPGSYCTVIASAI
jgi:hypothetical protein